MISLLYVVAFLHAVYSFTSSNTFGGAECRRQTGTSDYYNLLQRESVPVARKSTHILYMGAFNPFTSRQKNTRVRWFDTELSKFYTYVENQPLLTHEQELQYGKALSMWMQVCSVRDRMQAEKMTAEIMRGTTTTLQDPVLFSQPIDLEVARIESDFTGALSMGGSEGMVLLAPSVVRTPAVPKENVPPARLDASDLSAVPPEDPLRFDASELTAAAAADLEANLGGWSGEGFDGGKLMPCDIASCEISEDDLAAEVGCTKSTLDKMQRCAEISRTRLLNCNLKLVLAVVSRYRTSTIPNAELIAEGTRGLSRAVDRYDYSKGFRFATYATWYVHQAIFEYVRWRKHPAKMPNRYLVLQRKVKEFTTLFREEKKRQPEVKEIAVALQQSEFDIIKVLTMQTYPVLLNAPIAVAGSNNKPHDTSKDRTLEDLLASNFRNPTSITGSNDLRNDMEKMMQVNLNDVERDVLRLRLGLDDGRAKAVKEVGRRFKISWKEVRSVEKEALSKLLESSEIHEFVQNYESQPLSSV